MPYHQVLEDLIPGTMKKSLRTDLRKIIKIIHEMMPLPQMQVLTSPSNGWVTYGGQLDLSVRS